MEAKAKGTDSSKLADKKDHDKSKKANDEQDKIIILNDIDIGGFFVPMRYFNYLSIAAQIGQLLLQLKMALMLTGQMRRFLFLNAIFVLPQLFSLYLFSTYYQDNVRDTRAAQPLAYLVTIVTTVFLLFQYGLNRLKGSSL